MSIHTERKVAARFVDPKKRDPFRNFNFRIVLGGVEVAACRKMSGITGTVDVVKFRAGSNQASNEELSPGRTHYEAVTLEAGLTTDPEFERWALQLIRHDQITTILRASPIPTSGARSRSSSTTSTTTAR